MDKIIELLAKAKDYEIKKLVEGYEVTSRYNNVGAIVSPEDGIEYYVTNCYKSPDDWVELDLLALDELQKFCVALVELSISNGN